jgi:SAM-dependent methyltransferase
MDSFLCNICGKSNAYSGERFEREQASCSHCGSNVRIRGLLHALSMELFGLPMPVPDFPHVKSLRGLGMSDSNPYAGTLSEKFDYRNTYFDREPRFDIVNPDPHEFGSLDFLISSEVFEHVLPPVETAFANALKLLKESGVLVFTVPYSVEATSLEHYPDLHEFGFAQVGQKLVMVNRTADGKLQVFEDPVFHVGCSGEAVEAREFNETALRELISRTGFTSYRIYSEDYPPFGIVRAESWSLPIAA